MRSNRIVRWVRWVVPLMVVAAAIVGWEAWPRPIARPDYQPRLAELRGDEYFVYPPSHAPPRGIVVFFGNDVGFWEPHQELAGFLARQGFAVVGFDLRGLMRISPEASQVEREAQIGSAISRLVSSSASEFHGEKLPLILMGHSLGAEVAIWAGAHVAMPRLAGIIAMSPGARGHLEIVPSDFLSSALPTGPESFSVPDLVKALPKGVRVALVRGSADKYGSADPQIVAADGARLRRFVIPFAAHSLKRIIIARYVIEKAVEWSIEGVNGQTASGN
jgi:pimeloyl-ACP methyl ester carboxylesterase